MLAEFISLMEDPYYRGAYLEIHGTYKLLSDCSYNPFISRVTVVMELIFGLKLQLLSRL